MSMTLTKHRPPRTPVTPPGEVRPRRWGARLAWALIVVSPAFFVGWLLGALSDAHRSWLAVTGSVLGALTAPIAALLLGLWSGRAGNRSGTLAAVVAAAFVGIFTVWMGLSGWGG